MTTSSGFIIKNMLSALKPIPTDIKKEGQFPEGIKAVVFDIYGTLLVSGTGDIGISSLQRNSIDMDSILNESGFNVTIDGCKDAAPEILNRLIAEYHEKQQLQGVDYPEVDIREIWESTLQNLWTEGLLEENPDNKPVNFLALRYELSINPVWIMPGFPEIIMKLKKTGLHIGIVSNAQFYTPLIIEKLTGSTLERIGFNPDLCVWSYEIRRAKPSTDIFKPLLNAFSGMGITPSEILYVGNDMLNDVSAASAAGCKTALFAGDQRSLRLRKDDKRITGKPDIIITELQQLEKMIEQKDRKMTQTTRKKRHRGIRFFISLILVLAAIGTIFWFGWIQFSLKEGEYGVIYTTTNGYEQKTLKNGEFIWRWQALLPTNLTLHRFNLEKRSFTSKKSGTLPSGDYYALMAGENIDFSWNMEVEIIYRLKPEDLHLLMDFSGVRPSKLESYYSTFESRLHSELDRLFLAEAERAGDSRESFVNKTDRMEKTMKEKAAELDSHILIVDAVVKNWTYPDPVLYSETRRLVLDLLNKKQFVMSEMENSAARRENILEEKLGLLEQYGRILQEYPVLLDLFSLSGNPGAPLLPTEELY